MSILRFKRALSEGRLPGVKIVLVPDLGFDQHTLCSSQACGADQKPRVLICDGFGTHDTVEMLEYCFENNIILCLVA